MSLQIFQNAHGHHGQASSGEGLLAPRISVFDFSVSQVESEPLFQIGMKNFMIILRFGAAFRLKN